MSKRKRNMGYTKRDHYLAAASNDLWASRKGKSLMVVCLTKMDAINTNVPKLVNIHYSIASDMVPELSIWDASFLAAQIGLEEAGLK